MPIRRGYREGDHLVTDDVTGFVRRASETSKRWDGMIVDARNYETRHPQDYVRTRPDRQTVSDPRPDQAGRSQAPSGGAFFLVERDGDNTPSLVIAGNDQFYSYNGDAQPTPSSYGSGF